MARTTGLDVKVEGVHHVHRVMVALTRNTRRLDQMDAISVACSGACGDTTDREYSTYPLVTRTQDHVKYQAAEPASWRADGWGLRLTLETPDDTEIPIGDVSLKVERPGRQTIACGEGVEAELDIEVLQDGPDEHSDIRPMVWAELVQVTISLDRHQSLCRELNGEA